MPALVLTLRTQFAIISGNESRTIRFYPTKFGSFPNFSPSSSFLKGARSHHGLYHRHSESSSASGAGHEILQLVFHRGRLPAQGGSPDPPLSDDHRARHPEG